MTVYGGFQGKIEIAHNASGLLGASATATITQVQSFSAKTDHGTDLVHEIGQRSPIAAVEGPIEVTVTIERFMDTTTFYGKSFNALCGADNTSGMGANTYTDIGYYPNGLTAGQPKLVISNAKPTNYDFTATVDGQILEKAEFKAKYFLVGTL